VHGKRAVVEADRLLSADALEARVCAYYHCKRKAHFVMPKKVAWLCTRAPHKHAITRSANSSDRAVLTVQGQIPHDRMEPLLFQGMYLVD